MSAQHYADLDLTDPDWPTVEFVCTGGPEDVCRQWCAEGCEEYCTDYQKRIPAGPGYPNGTYITTGHRWEFRADASEPCREMEWLEAVGWQESGWVDEPDEGGEREVNAGDLRPGRHLIETEWTGDDYIWRYPAGLAVTDAGVPR